MNPIIKFCDWIDALPAELFVIMIVAIVIVAMLAEDIATARKRRPERRAK